MKKKEVITFKNVKKMNSSRKLGLLQILKRGSGSSFYGSPKNYDSIDAGKVTKPEASFKRLMGPSMIV
ncbi:hypothetical protein OIU85_005203 [Salix viminalis]|uniref:Uncharacterized protein n=1 Tax=Salix viminalis TaxID=40686 RepID=A0A9Q0PUC3_SALVM|nr:hypothetical protein OIU85_005203 [Salix viminalis]